MAVYLGLAMMAGYWSATQFVTPRAALHEDAWPSGITASTQPQSWPAEEPTSGVVYHNCTEARAAGVTPIYEGQPGYAPWLDADRDGIACEPYHPRYSDSR